MLREFQHPRLQTHFFPPRSRPGVRLWVSQDEAAIRNMSNNNYPNRKLTLGEMAERAED